MIWTGTGLSDSLVNHFRAPPQTASHPEAEIHLLGVPLVRRLHRQSHPVLYEPRIHGVRLLRVS